MGLEMCLFLVSLMNTVQSRNSIGSKHCLRLALQKQERRASLPHCLQQSCSRGHLARNYSFHQLANCMSQISDHDRGTDDLRYVLSRRCSVQGFLCCFEEAFYLPSLPSGRHIRYIGCTSLLTRIETSENDFGH